jgi:hypothetical protein
MEIVVPEYRENPTGRTTQFQRILAEEILGSFFVFFTSMEKYYV